MDYRNEAPSRISAEEEFDLGRCTAAGKYTVREGLNRILFFGCPNGGGKLCSTKLTREGLPEIKFCADSVTVAATIKCGGCGWKGELANGNFVGD